MVPPLHHRAATLALAVCLAVATLAAGPTVGRADGPAAGARSHLAGTLGGAPADYDVLYERTVADPAGAAALWVGKLAGPDGAVHTVYRDAAGRFGDASLLEARDEVAIAATGGTAFAAKADADLRARVAARPEATVGVAVWLDVDTTVAEAEAAAANPDVAWVDGRPAPTSLEEAREIRRAIWDAKRALLTAAADRLRRDVARLGGSVAYTSSAAPLVFVDIAGADADRLAELPSVASLGLERTWRPSMSTAAPTVDANWTTGSGDSGAGVRVAVVEYHNVRNSGDLAGRVVASHSSTGTLAYTSGSQFDHPTWVAGAIAGGGTYGGTAPASRIVTASTGGGGAGLTRDRAVIATTDWAVSPSGGDADIVNLSLIQDTSTGAEEARRYFDSVVDEDLRVVVAASGNYSALGTWTVGSPGTGWNVLTVGGTDDRNTAGRGDDRIWYVPGSNGSSYVDPPGTAWNPHGDFNKPNLSAPAVGVRTANGLAASGTSVATPIVSGLAAQLVSRAPILASWPETVRSLLIAGAVHRTRMPNGSYDADHEGAGSASGLWANRILVAGDGTYGGYRHGAMSGSFSQAISVAGGQRIRVALTWNSRTSGSTNLGKTDTLASDLDVRIRLPNGAVYGSYSLDNSYETLDVVSPIAGTATVEVIGARVGSGGERYSLAWAKIGGDTRPPVTTARAPEHGEPWAPTRTDVTVTFSEPVTSLVPANAFVAPAGGGSAVSASLSYAASARRLTIRPSAPLAPGTYRVSLTNGIRDLAGNRLAAISWTFTVVPSAGSWQTSLPSAPRVALDAGTHVGYQFDSGGRVVASRTATLTADSGANVDRRAAIVGQPGRWLRIVNGIWAGYWVRESPRAALAGTQESAGLAAGTRVTFSTGQHTGYQFAPNGSITARRTASLAATSGADASTRAVINGRWHLLVTNGIWAGYWIPETTRSYVAGALAHRDLDGATARFRAGTHGGYRFAANGTVTGAKTATLGSPSTAPVLAWAIVDGAPRLLIGAGVWSGYWVTESGAVAVP